MIVGFMQKHFDTNPTDFEEKILRNEKIHTIRKGKRWRYGMLMHMCTGVRTKKQRQFALKTVVSVQDIKVKRTVEPINKQSDIKGPVLRVWVDGKLISKGKLIILLDNDGINLYYFDKHFFPKGGEGVITGQIIHWTNLKY